MKKTLVCVTICLSTLIMANAGPKWDVGEDGWMKAAFLGQAHYSIPDNAAYDQDFYIRRARIILMGQMTDGIMFFAETDNDKAGKKGTSVSTDIQDAFIDVRLFKSDKAELWVEAGLILLPFSFETKASAASLLGNDYNAEAIKLANTFVWRDNGAELHGFIGKKFAARIGVFDGYDTEGSSKSDMAALRYTGHIALNLLGDVETGWFLCQNRLDKDNYLAIGAGYDQQDKATSIITEDAEGNTTETGQKDSSAWVADFMSGFSLSENYFLTINGAYAEWDSAVYDGSTTFIEAGLRFKKVMLSGKTATQNPDAGSSIEDQTVGLHYFQKGHNARYGIEFRTGDSDDWTLASIQFLL